MPYCTIEEAWKTTLNPNLENCEKSSKGYDNEKEYYNINLPNSEIYNEKGEEIRKKNCRKKKKKKRIPNFSRTYNRLPEHNGPKSRFKGDKQKRLIREDSEQEFTLDNKQNHPSYLNADLPINDYNDSIYQTLNDEYLKKGSSENFSLMEDFSDDLPNLKNDVEENTQNETIEELKKENEKLKKLIEELKNDKKEDKDSFLDLVMFIATGIIIILILENITKLIRKF